MLKLFNFTAKIRQLDPKMAQTWFPAAWVGRGVEETLLQGTTADLQSTQTWQRGDPNWGAVNWIHTWLVVLGISTHFTVPKWSMILNHAQSFGKHFYAFVGGITFSCDSPHGSGCEHFLPGSKTSLMGVSHFFSLCLTKKTSSHIKISHVPNFDVGNFVYSCFLGPTGQFREIL